MTRRGCTGRGRRSWGTGGVGIGKRGLGGTGGSGAGLERGLLGCGWGCWA